jgi:CxxC motif-containing protein
MKKEMTCISCPIGCAMTAEIQVDGNVTVVGNQCSRGAQYARAELVDPRRVVTATCRTGSSIHPRLPVRTTIPCPREKIPALLEKIYAMTVSLPVKQGDVLGSFEDVQIVATRSVGE